MSKVIYRFGQHIDTGMFDSTIVGGKGAKLAEMGSLGLPVPAGVTITTGQCNKFLVDAGDDAAQADFIDSLVNDVLTEFESIAEDNGYMPLVSVRSGARVSMPGMMDTVLNVGINSENFDDWVERIGEDAAMDCYKRLIVMYSETVIGMPAEVFEVDTVPGMLERYLELTGESFPQAIEEQLAGSIAAVFNSWHSERAQAYRARAGYPDHWGTAVNVQQMVFGNRNEQSCSGVLFSRNFNTGAAETVIDWLPNAQGEDVVAGTHTPLTKVALLEWNQSAYDELGGYAAKMEAYYRDMQDMEFTVEDGKLYILQTRDGKRSARAAFKIAWDMHMSGTLSQSEALARVTGKQYIALFNPSIDPTFTEAPCVTGIPAAGSIVSGVAVLSSDAAINCKEDCILVSEETTPNDFPGMSASVGILTRTGGITSHAAVVARGMDKTCVVGAEDLVIADLAGKQITLDGATGRVWVEKNVPIVVGQVDDHVKEMISWALAEDDSFFAVAPESVSKDTSASVDVSAYLSTQKSLSSVLDLLKASGGDGVISFGKNAPNQPQDAHFLGFFGVSSPSYDVGTYMVIEKVLKMKKWTKTFKKNWALHLPSACSVDYANVLRSHGWKVVTVVDSFKAAFHVDGYVVMDESFLAQLTREQITFGEIETLIRKSGRTVKELPVAVSKTRRLFDVLGG
jgi:pyruvate,orthophosphate dikinase